MTGNSVTTIDIMRRWAPVVYFHKKEAYFPSSVWWYLDQVTLVDAGSGAKTHGPPVTADILRIHSGDQGKTTTKYQLNIPDDAASERDIRPGEPLVACPESGVPKSVMHSPAPAYCHGLRRNDQIVDLQYWFFFPYDEAVGWFDDLAGSHEGDWEHVTVRIRWTENYTPGVGGDPMAAAALSCMYASAHNGEGRWNESPHLERCDDGNNHPVVYCARGTHAGYTDNNASSFSSWQRFFSQDYTGDTGARWYTYRNIEQIQWSDRDSDDLCWLAYNGQWGATDIGIDSPYGPAMKPEWKGDSG